jgi:hypothetical protein
VQLSALRVAPLCPYCLESVREEALCLDCGADYHRDCAAAFGRCVVLGCGARLDEEEVDRVLPRLPQLAHGLSRWRLADLGQRPFVGDPSVVVLKPVPRAARDRIEAAEALGEVLGDDADEGRLRLLGGYPEPLMRVEESLEATQIRLRLAEASLDSFLVPLRQLLRPLREREVTSLALDPLRLSTEDGPAELASGSRLVVPVQFVRLGRGSGASGSVSRRRPGGTGRFARDEPDRRSEAAAFVFGPGDPVPLLLRARNMRRLRGFPTTTSPAQRLSLVLRELAGDEAHERPLENARAPALLIPGLDGLDNHTSVALIARLMFLAWEEERRRHG